MTKIDEKDRMLRVRGKTFRRLDKLTISSDDTRDMLLNRLLDALESKKEVKQQPHKEQEVLA